MKEQGTRLPDAFAGCGRNVCADAQAGDIELRLAMPEVLIPLGQHDAFICNLAGCRLILSDGEVANPNDCKLAARPGMVDNSGGNL